MNLKKIIITSFMIAIGIILPVAMHTLPNAGKVFLPMHIPIFIAGLICGGFYGFVCGILTPLLSSILTGMPTGVYLPLMIFELATYGAVAGILFKTITTKNKDFNLYISLIIAMIAGRIVFGVLNALVFNVGEYSLQIWLTSAFVTSLPGIILQIAIIPVISNLLIELSS